MKTLYSRTYLALVAILGGLTLGGLTTQANTYNWTNTLGGDWSAAANWSPNQVPGSGDTAIITNAGTYAVVQDGNLGCHDLILGATGGSGTQTFLSGPFTFSMYGGSIVVNPHGSFQLISGTLNGNATIQGQINWTGGQFGSGNNVFTLATNATLVLAGNNGMSYVIGEVVTNMGTIRIASGNLTVSFCGSNYGALTCLPGALIDFQTDGTLDQACGASFLNQGTLRKSGGTGVTSINAVLQNHGSVDAETGTINLTGGGGDSGGIYTGPGMIAITNGTYTESGTLTSSNLMLTGGILNGNGTIQGLLTWTGGQFGSGNNFLTLATNATLVLAGVNGTDYNLGQYVTNAGTIRIVGGNLAINYCSYYGVLNNLPGGLVDLHGDVSIDGCGGTGFINQGILTKSGGTGVSLINQTFQNTGTVNVPTGTVALYGNTSDSGGQYIGAGTTILTNGTFAETGTLTCSNLVLAGGLLYGNGSIQGHLTWIGGQFGNGNNFFTLATNTTLVLAGVNGTDYNMGEYVTNAGTIRVVSGNFAINWCNYYGVLNNLPGALVDLHGDVSIDGCGGTGFINQGTLNKSAGTGVSAVNQAFLNSGTVNVQSGTLSLTMGTSDNGGSYVGPGVTLLPSGTFFESGTLVSSNLVLGGATLLGNGSIKGLLLWTKGVFGQGNLALTLATNATLVLAGDNGISYSMAQVVTNAGTILLQSGNLDIAWCGAGQYGTLINLPGGLVNFQADVSIVGDTCSLGLVNAGTVLKSGGTGVTYINSTVENTGTVDAETGTISFNSGATVNDTGGKYIGPGVTLLASGIFNQNGTLTCNNMVLGGATFQGNGTISGLLTWTNGVFGQGNRAMTLASNGTLVLAGINGTNYLMSQILTNAGTIRLQSGNLDIADCGGGQYGALINLPGGLVNFQADVSISGDSCSPGLNNAGTLRKSGGTGTSGINTTFNNTGTVDAQTGLIALKSSYSLANGSRLNFGIISGNNYGQIALPGPAAFSGSVSANFENPFYWPTVGTTFKLLSYTAETGILFTNTTLPAFITWTTNYSATNFAIAALARSTNPAPTSLFMSSQGDSNLFLEWYGDRTGWELQTQTNTLAVGLSTNWLTVPGSSVTNQVTLPVVRTNPAVFFRLTFP